jgi:protein TonB
VVAVSLGLKFIETPSKHSATIVSKKKLAKPKIPKDSDVKKAPKPVQKLSLKQTPNKKIARPKPKEQSFNIKKPTINENIKSTTSTILSSSSNHSQKLNKDHLSNYLTIIRNRIEENRNYPFLARRQGLEGMVIVIFSLNYNGSLEDIKVKKSSGYKLLDQAALEAIEKATPFPPFPKALKEKTLSLVLPLCFKLK